MRLFTIIILLLTVACNDDTSNMTHLEGPADTMKVAKDTNNGEREFVGFNLKHKFEDFGISVYRGRLADPRTTDKELSGDTSFINYISEVCKNKGVNFGGHYTVVHSNCGAMCEGLYIVDRISGNVFSKLRPNNGGRWGYLYKKNSKMLIANSNGLDSSLQRYSAIFDAPEIYVWTGDTLRQIQ